MEKKSFFRKIIPGILILVLGFFLISLKFQKASDPLERLFFRLAWPLQKVFSDLGNWTGESLSFWKSISQVKEENKKLIKENNQLLSDLAELEEARRENRVLREQAGLREKEKFNLEGSLVIGENPQRLSSWIMIDKGENAGLKAGMPVIVAQGILVGKVDEVFRESSKVSLLTDTGSVVNVRDVETQAKGVVRGEFGLGLLMEMVSQEDDLKAGDLVVTSGLGGNFPKGLLVGRIQEIRPSLDKIFKQALISPPVKYSNLEVVFVIKN
jgi:rod shape-determining protein MreC